MTGFLKARAHRLAHWLVLVGPRVAAWALRRIEDPAEREKVFAAANRRKGCLFVRPGEEVIASEREYLYIYCEGTVRLQTPVTVHGDMVFAGGGALVIPSPKRNECKCWCHDRGPDEVSLHFGGACCRWQRPRSSGKDPEAS